MPMVVLDNACVRGRRMLMPAGSLATADDPWSDAHIEGDAYRTIFVGRLAAATTDGSRRARPRSPVRCGR